MEVKEKVENPLTVKVMRLTRPTLSTPVIVTCENKDLPGHLFNTSLKNDITSINGAESLAVGQFLLVPQSFGSIYLGEIFSCYISVYNDSNDSVPNVILKADLQTQSQRLPVINHRTLETLSSKQTLDEVIHHEVKETGTHILVCEVTYSNNLSFRKFFKFQVLKPLDVKTKFYTAESDDVYLEALIQNITAGPICLEKVSLESSDYFTVSDLNAVGKDSISVFGKINVLDKDAYRQYLYCLTPKYDAITGPKMKLDSIRVGILDIEWRSNLGEKGHLQTSMLQTVHNDRGDFRFSLTEFPNIVFLEKPFQVSCRITNISLYIRKSRNGKSGWDVYVEVCYSRFQAKWVASGGSFRKLFEAVDHEINVCIFFDELKSMTWCGISGKPNKIAPSKNIEVQLHLIPLDLGLQTIGGIRVKDTISQQYCEFNNLAEVFVLQ